MFEQITDRRYKEASAIVNELRDYSTESIITSGLSDFTKSFIINDGIIPDTKQELLKVIDKAIKLNLNYCIRPKWTMINYIYGSYDSRNINEINKKVEVFTYYSFYTEPIKDLCSDKTYVSVPRAIIEDLIDEINNSIYNKLVTGTTGLKIKNFFLQVFKFKYGDNAEISLDMSVPYSFIRLFLEDKGYTEIVKMFKEAGISDDGDEIELKTAIKIISGRVKEGNIFAKETVAAPEETKEEDTVIHTETKQTEKAEPTVTEESDVITYEKISPVEEELESGIASEFEEKEKDESDHLRFHFKEDELKSIAKKVFNGSRYVMQDALLEIEQLKNWREATEYLKAVFLENNVNISDKTVILFVDVLNDYFEKR